jgi:hypothetical protein
MGCVHTLSCDFPSLHISTLRNTLHEMWSLRLLEPSTAFSSYQSQAQHERVFSLRRYAAGKAELLVVACREDCAISHCITS